MGLLKLPQKRNDGVEYIDHRPSMYYNKYQYRLRFYLDGLTLCWFSKSEKELEDRAKKHKRYAKVDIESIKQFFNWMNVEKSKKDKQSTIRIEHNIGAVFTNDLTLFKSLIAIGPPTDITEVDPSIPAGIKYFAKQPEFKYRVHLKSKRVKDDFPIKIYNFFKRYEKSETKMKPSKALARWLIDYQNGSTFTGWSWRLQYVSSHFYFDYDDESTLTLFMLMFSDVVHRRYKLEKRPEPV